MSNFDSYPNAIRHRSLANLERELQTWERMHTREPYSGYNKLVNMEKKKINFMRKFDTIKTPIFDTLGVNPYGNPGSLSIDTVYEKQKELYNAYPTCAKKYWESHERQVVGVLGSVATAQSRIANYVKLFFETEKHCAYLQMRLKEGGKRKTRRANKSKKTRKVRRS